MVHGAFKTLVLLHLRKPESKVGAATIQAGVVKEISQATLSRMQLPALFLTYFGGLVAVAFADHIGGSHFGAIICLGLFFYFALEIWVDTTKPSPRPFLAADMLLQIAPAICFLAAGVAWFAI